MCEINIVIVSRCINFFRYMFLGWYLEQVIPSQYGSHRPWYFLVQPSYWSKTVRERQAQEKRSKAADYEVCYATVVGRLSWGMFSQENAVLEDSAVGTLSWRMFHHKVDEYRTFAGFFV